MTCLSTSIETLISAFFSDGVSVLLGIRHCFCCMRDLRCMKFIMKEFTSERTASLRTSVRLLSSAGPHLVVWPGTKYPLEYVVHCCYSRRAYISDGEGLDYH